MLKFSLHDPHHLDWGLMIFAYNVCSDRLAGRRVNALGGEAGNRVGLRKDHSISFEYSLELTCWPLTSAIIALTEFSARAR